MNQNERIILASASPRRKELLSKICEDFEVIPSHAEEIIPQEIPPQETAEYLAQLKAKDIALQHPDAIVIGCDTVVIAENQVLGKPKNKEECISFLNLLSGNRHKVVTGCAIIKNQKTYHFSVETEVYFYPLTETEIMAYANSDEPYDKAGGYGIQGTASLFIEKINGDYFNVVGLPVSRLYQEFKKIR